MIESMSPRRALLLGALTVGVLDILDAFIFFGIRGVPPLRILQAIASGVLGREAAVAGGLATAALGLLLHFFIAFIIVLVFYLVSRKVPILTRYPFVTGALYGVAVYFIMTLVVVPSLIRPTAVNCCVAPAASEAFAGATSTAVSVGAGAVMVTLEVSAFVSPCRTAITR